MLARVSCGARASGVRSLASVAERFAAEPSAVTYERYGAPEKVLRWAPRAVPKESLKADQVQVRMLAAPITPSDLSAVGGFGGNGVLPATGGNEGYGVVEKVGSGVSDLREGDFVVPALPGAGTWATHTVLRGDCLCKVPETSQVEVAAVSAINPSLAHCLLQMEELEAGDVVLQNNGGSGVAQCVLQVAAERGLVVVNVRRPHPAMEELQLHYEGLNGAVVHVPEPIAVTPRMGELLADLPAPKLALDGTGGAMASALARHLAPGGLLVSYGQMSRKPVVLSGDLLLRKQIRVRGFSYADWARATGKERRDALIQHCVTAALDQENPKYSQLLAWEPFTSDGFQEGLARATEDYQRKIVLVMNPDEAKLEPTPRASLTDPVAWREDSKN